MERWRPHPPEPDSPAVAVAAQTEVQAPGQGGTAQVTSNPSLPGRLLFFADGMPFWVESFIRVWHLMVTICGCALRP